MSPHVLSPEVSGPCASGPWLIPRFPDQETPGAEGPLACSSTPHPADLSRSFFTGSFSPLDYKSAMTRDPIFTFSSSPRLEFKQHHLL